MSGAATLLREVFGFDAFRPGQEEIVQTVAAGCNTLAIMPTGGGKSLCYQLPAVLSRGVTVIVCPLLALMQDQVEALVRGAEGADPALRGVPATFLSISSLSIVMCLRAALSYL